MKHSGLRLLTVMVAAVMAVVPFLGLDDLPKATRSAIDAERAALTSTTAQIDRAKSEVSKELQTDADVFRSVPASQQWPTALASTQTVLKAANRDSQQLAELEKRNREATRRRTPVAHLRIAPSHQCAE
jgi:Tfp pilus assembly protein PilV